MIEDLEEMAKNSNVPTFGQEKEFGIKEKVFMGEILGLEDDPRSKSLSGFKPISERNVKRMPSDAAIFENRANKSQVQKPPSRGGGIIKNPVDKTNCFPSLLADVVNMDVPRKIAGDMNAKEFDRRNSFNHLVIDAELKVGKRILFGRNDH